MKLFQIGQQIVLQSHITGADAYLPSLQIPHPAQSLLAHLQLLIAPGHILKQRLPLLSQADTLCHPIKQRDAQLLFQLPYRLTHRRLGNGQRLGCRSQAAQACHMIENLVIFQITDHNRSPLEFRIFPSVLRVPHIPFRVKPSSADCHGR